MIRYSQKQLGQRLWIVSTFHAEISCYSYICTIDVQCQAKSLAWMIVSGSCSSKLLSLSRLILSRSTARICLWLAINVTLSKSSLEKSISILYYQKKE